MPRTRSFPDADAAAGLTSRIVSAVIREKPVALVAGESPGLASPHVADVRGASATRADVERRWAAIAHADGFIGTWSDESMLAVLFGIPTVVIAPTNPAWATRLDLTIRMARATGAPLTIVDMPALPLLAVVAGGIADNASEPSAASYY